MKALAPIGSSLLVLLATACEQKESQAAPPSQQARRPATTGITVDSNSRIRMPSRPTPEEPKLGTLTDQIYRVPDEELEGLLQKAVEVENPSSRMELLTVLYEETRMRSPITRLPLLLEIARAADTHPSLRDTIMAELGTTLQTDHGRSWTDWALALDEYLAAKQGLIRVK